MKIIVLLRAVHADPISEQVLPIISPCDRAALQTALSLSEDPDVTALCIGPEPDNAVLQLALNAGAKRAIRFFDPMIKRCNVDTLGTLLSRGIQQLGFDLVLAGQYSLDWGSGATAPIVAHYLKVPHVTSVIATRIQDGGLEVDQLREDGILTLAMPFPSLIAIAAGPPTTNLVSRKPEKSAATIEEWTQTDLNLTLTQVFLDPEISLDNSEPLPAVEFMNTVSLLAELKKVGLLP